MRKLHLKKKQGYLTPKMEGKIVWKYSPTSNKVMKTAVTEKAIFIG